MRIPGSVIVSLALSLAACTTPSGPPFADYDPIPPGGSRLYVYRPSYTRSAWQRLEVTVNGQPLTDLADGGYVSVVLPPGGYRVAAGFHGMWVRSEDLYRKIYLHADEAIYCSFTSEYHLMPQYLSHELECSDEPVAHPDLWRCSRDEVEENARWKP